MFRATMCPSSGETTVFMRYLVLVILCGWLSGMQEHSNYQVSHKYGCFSCGWLVCRSIYSCMTVLHMLLHTRQPSTQDNKYQVSHKYSCFSCGCLVCRSICSCTPDNHPHRITSTKYRINTVVSPVDDWYAGAYIPAWLCCICSRKPDSHPHRITITKCCMNTVVLLMMDT